MKRQISMRKSALIAILLVTACAEPPALDKPRDQMSQRERDSTIADARLPGSGVVRKGLSIADKGAKRAALLDSIGKDN